MPRGPRALSEGLPVRPTLRPNRGAARARATVDVDVVPVAKLRRIKALHADAPKLRRDDDGLDDAPGKSKRC